MDQQPGTSEQLREQLRSLQQELDELRHAARERTQIELALRESEERYRAFVQNSSEGIWRFELDQPVSLELPVDEQIQRFYDYGYLAECNRAMAQMYGLDQPEQLMGVRLGQLLIQEDPHNLAYLRAFIASGYQLLDAESHEVDGSGNPKYFLNNLVGIIENGALLRAWGSQRDITLHRQEDERQRFLVKASSLLVASLELGITLSNLAQLVVPTLGDSCAIHLLKGDSVQLMSLHHHDPEQLALLERLGARYQLDLEAPHRLLQVLRTGQPYVQPSIPLEQVLAGITDSQARQLLEQLAPRSVMIVPLQTRGQILGAITLLSSSQRNYNQHDQDLVQELALRAATAVDNASLYQDAQLARQRAERAMERTSCLQTLVGAFSEALLPAQVADVVLTQGLAEFGAGAGSIVLLDRQRQELQVIAALGYDPEVIGQWQRFPLASSVPLADAMRELSPVWIETVKQFEQRYPHIASTSRSQGGAWAAIPLIVHSRAIGAMGLSFSSARQFAQEDRAFILALAHHCAQALDRARLYEEIQQALQVRDQFLSLAAHELKTPLTAILGSAQLIERRIERDEHSSERERRSAQTLVAQIRRLHRLSNSLLDLSRMQEGRFSISRQPLDLCALLFQLASELQTTLGQHTLRLEGMEQRCVINGDQLRLEQVFQNLLHNAIKYSPDGGEISLTLVPAEERISVIIADHGLGIPEAAIPRIFDRFYRASNIDTRQISGMGVGLYVVREIIALHGGSVEVESNEGQGSTFRVHLPHT